MNPINLYMRSLAKTPIVEEKIESFNISFTDISDNKVEFKIFPGNTVFILGANGVGKSALLHKIYTSNQKKAKKITAHRQMWFSTNSPEMTPQGKTSIEKTLIQSDLLDTSRWRDEYSQQRLNLAIYDFIEAENKRARIITHEIESNPESHHLNKVLAENVSPLQQLNKLLNSANLPIKISIKDDSRIFAQKNSSELYSISELSDGERNVLLIAANVLTAERGSLLLIDEPERHLHKSIISPFLNDLIKVRPDCAFIISTHDHTIINDDKNTKVILVRSCLWLQNSIIKWDTDIVDSVDEIDDSLLYLILGERRKVLFIEGNAMSIDNQLYKLIFPNVSINPVKDCREVINTVKSIINSKNLHWIEPYGLIDNDDRSEVEIIELQDNNIFSIPYYSVEAIYYNPTIIKALMNSLLIEENLSQLYTKIIDEIKNVLHQDKERLCLKLIERQVRDQVFHQLPKKEDYKTNINININVDEISSREIEKFNTYYRADRIDLLVARYPLKETNIKSVVSKSLRFLRYKDYESAVRSLLKKDEKFANLVKSMIGDLANKFII